MTYGQHTRVHTCKHEDMMMMSCHTDPPSDSVLRHSLSLAGISCESHWTSPDEPVGQC